MLRRRAPLTALSIWTVYFNPSDYPEKYVVRESWSVHGPSGGRGHGIVTSLDCAVVDSLDAARAAIPGRKALTRLPRQEADDPVIVECWF